jgi:subtilisin family serine protease
MKLFIVMLITFTLFLYSCQESTDLGVNTTEENSEFSLAKKPTATASANGEYLVISKSNKLPKKFSKSVADLNGEVKMIIPEIGVAVISIDDPEVVAGMNGISAVIQDIEVQWLNPDQKVEPMANPPSIGDNEWYFWMQWGLDAIDAPEAWNAEYRGAGSRVFILDSGIDADHPDLASNLNTELSISFIAGEDWNVQPAVEPEDIFNHGTHVAGIVAAADDEFGVIGVAPESEIVAVKVLSEFTGSGPFSAILAGIVYAANNEADVINMSLGAYFPRSVFGSQLVVAITRATNYAHQMGVTIVSSAGNEAADRNHDANWLHLPSDAANVISVSATGPIGWAYDPNTFLDNLASYSNYGQSEIDFAAPGGDYQLWPHDYWAYDMVLSTGNGGWYWGSGTSQASPHLAGVAALIIGKNGGSMKPAHVEAVLRASADDFGKPGKDAFYGHGRVNAHKAVMN